MLASFGILLFLVLLLALAIYFVITFNRLQSLRNGAEAALSQIRVAIYPSLKTSEAVIAAMNAIRDLEDEIARHRYIYNNIIKEFNTMRDTFPSRLIAGGMSKIDYLSFEGDELRRAGYYSGEDEEPHRPEVQWK